MNLPEEVVEHYASTLRRESDPSRRVGWRDEIAQIERFEAIWRLVVRTGCDSISDLGCGIGDMLTFLRRKGYTGDYLGVDASKDMVVAATIRHVTESRASFVHGQQPEAADVVVASGIFNVRLGLDPIAWSSYCLGTLEQMWGVCRDAICFNMLTTDSDADRRSTNLHYVSPTQIVRHCVSQFSRNVAMDQSYGLFDFTVLVSRRPLREAR